MKITSYRKKEFFRKQKIFFTTMLVLIGLLASSMFVFAGDEEDAMRSLQGYVYNKVSETEYTLEGGGSLKGKDLFEGSATKGYDLKEYEFQRLSSKAQSQLVSDIATYSEGAVDDVSGVEESTVQSWWKQLQTKDGVGSKFMNEILSNTKPDFVTANKIYQPFSGVIGTLMGIMAILIMGFLGLVMVSDIAYIVIPPFRLFVSDEANGNGGKISKSKLFSDDAIYAVRVAEEDNGSNGNKKQALGIYFKRRVVMLIILGICLLYLVQGQIYTLVGILLDLVSGFLGF